MKIRLLIIKITSRIIVSLLLLNFAYCSSSKEKVTDEGVIEYDTKAVDEKHPWAGMAPSKATLRFKKNKFIMEMSTMGMFNTMFVADLDAKTITQMVKFLDIKQAHIETEKDIISDNGQYRLKMEETQDTKLIAGYKCHKVNISMVGDPAVKFEAWYTKEMDMPNVNELSPYKGIKGMLMQYRLKRMGLEMQFTVREVKKEEVSDNTFEVPAYFKIVGKEEIEKIFSSLQ